MVFIKENYDIGGDQLRPNIHIKDMIRAYHVIMEADPELINGEVFNAGWENKSVKNIAFTVKNVLGDDIKLSVTPTDDNRSIIFHQKN